MSTHFSVFIATSLDGFIARPDGNLDWLLGATTSVDDHGYAAYMSSIDAIVMGRNTFEVVLTFGEWPFDGKNVIVLSRTLTSAAIPRHLHERVSVHLGPVQELAQSLERDEIRCVYVDGGQVIQSFLAAGLLKEITITRVPVIIGAGIPLFSKTSPDIRLEHLRTRAFESGFVQSTYRLKQRGLSVP